jgi:phosphatidylserine decarboxylase
MQTITDWLNQPEIQAINKQPVRKLLQDSLNRDPNRAIYVDPDCFLSPADGVVLYCEVVKPNEQVIEVKGENYTTEELLKEEIKETCLVIGIFMSCLDVHINRVPTDGYLKHKALDALKVMNLSMRSVENSILEEIGIDTRNFNYALYNERVRNRIYCPQIKQHYWLVQIADMEVDVIAHFAKPNEMYTQGERFSVVRLGSQCDLIIPFINKKIKFESLVKVHHHVEAGIDKIVKIEKGA